MGTECKGLCSRYCVTPRPRKGSWYKDSAVRRCTYCEEFFKDYFCCPCCTSRLRIHSRHLKYRYEDPPRIA